MKKSLVISRSKLNERLHTVTSVDGISMTRVYVGNKFKPNPYGNRFKLKRAYDQMYPIDIGEELVSFHGIDVEEELSRILIEEINREIEMNGSKTWKEICEEEEFKL